MARLIAKDGRPATHRLRQGVTGVTYVTEVTRRGTMAPGTAVIRISADLDGRISRLANVTGRSKSYYASKAIEGYLDDGEAVNVDIAALEHVITPQAIEAMRRELA